MSNEYENNYGVTFGGKHSFRDYRLLPLSAPVISPPTVKTYYVEVPGSDGSLDLTEALTGYPTYGDRKGEFTFQFYAPKEDWYDIYNTIVHDLHGKKMDVLLDEDAQYFYKGRLSVDTPSFGKTRATIGIKGVFSSNRYKGEKYSGNSWEWDDFDFENGVAREYYKMPIRWAKRVVLLGSEIIVCPNFYVDSGQLTVFINGVPYDLQSGDNIFLNVLLTEENLNLTFTGLGEVTIKYRIGGDT